VAVTLRIEVFGFGSAFAKHDKPNDIDLLIVHSVIDRPSCELAIACKRWLLERIAGADVTMLSRSEVAHFRFIEMTRAFCLGTVRKAQIDRDLMAVLNEVHCNLQFDVLPISKK
jgi:hypothetical protein